MLFLLFTVTSVTLLKTNTTQYCCSIIAEWPPALSDVQGSVFACGSISTHGKCQRWHTQSCCFYISNVLYTLMVVVMQNRNTNQTPPLLYFTLPDCITGHMKSSLFHLFTVVSCFKQL